MAAVGTSSVQAVVHKAVAVVAAVVAALLLAANTTFQQMQLQQMLLWWLLLAAAEAENCRAKIGDRVEQPEAVAVAATEEMAQTE